MKNRIEIYPHVACVFADGVHVANVSPVGVSGEMLLPAMAQALSEGLAGRVANKPLRVQKFRADGTRIYRKRSAKLPPL